MNSESDIPFQNNKEHMYFVISRINKKQFEHRTFDDTVDWQDMIKSINGDIIELFQNSNMEKVHFDEYFKVNYNKKHNEFKTW